MIGWLASFIPWWIWALAALAAVFAIRTYLGAQAAMLAGAAIALVAAYQTGVNAERKRGEAAGLRQTIEIMKRDAAVTLDIQTRMAQRLSELRVVEREQDGRVDAFIAKLRTKPVSAACGYTADERLQLNSIRIAPPVNSRSR